MKRRIIASCCAALLSQVGFAVECELTSIFGLPTSLHLDHVGETTATGVEEVKGFLKNGSEQFPLEGKATERDMELVGHISGIDIDPIAYRLFVVKSEDEKLRGTLTLVNEVVRHVDIQMDCSN